MLNETTVVQVIYNTVTMNRLLDSVEEASRKIVELSVIKGSFMKYGHEVSYAITEEQKDKIVARLMEYYSTHCHFGEGIHQDDDSLIEAPSVLSDICDNIINFEEPKDE